MVENLWAVLINPAGAAHSAPPESVAGGERQQAPSQRTSPRSRPSEVRSRSPINNPGHALVDDFNTRTDRGRGGFVGGERGGTCQSGTGSSFDP